MSTRNTFSEEEIKYVVHSLRAGKIDVRHWKELKPVTVEEAKLLYDLGSAVYVETLMRHDWFHLCWERPWMEPWKYGVLKEETTC